MKNTVKRSICLLLAVLLAFSTVMTAGAADLTEDEAKNYTITMQSVADESKTYSATPFLLDDDSLAASLTDIPAGEYNVLVYDRSGAGGNTTPCASTKLTVTSQKDVSICYVVETKEFLFAGNMRYDFDGTKYYLEEVRDGVTFNSELLWWKKDVEDGNYYDGPFITIKCTAEQSLRVVDDTGAEVYSQKLTFSSSDPDAVFRLYICRDSDGNISFDMAEYPEEINADSLYLVQLLDQDGNEVDWNYCQLISDKNQVVYQYAALLSDIAPGSYTVRLMDYNIEGEGYDLENATTCDLNVTGTEDVDVLVYADSTNNYEPETEVLRYTAKVYRDGELVKAQKALSDGLTIGEGAGTWRYDLYRDGKLESSQSITVDREGGIVAFVSALDLRTGKCDVASGIYPAEINKDNLMKVVVTDQIAGSVVDEVYLDCVNFHTNYCVGTIDSLPAGSYQVSLFFYRFEAQEYISVSETDLVLTDTEDVAVSCRSYDLFLSTSADQTFADVPDGYWAGDAIRYGVGLGLFNGTSSSTFSPTASMSRQTLMTVLARLDGQVASTTADGMAWAVEQGISDGANPTDTISRQQLAVMLYRYAGEPDANESLDAFPDAGDVADYADAAMRWAVANGVIVGTADGRLDPTGTATRAQAAAVAARYMALIV